MLEFTYNYSSYKSFIDQLAATVGTTVQEDTIVFPESFASGYMRRIELPEGLQAIYASFTLHKDFYLHRIKSNVEFYTLRFDK